LGCPEPKKDSRFSKKPAGRRAFSVYANYKPNYRRKEMAASICPRCAKPFFEVVERKPADSNFKFLFVQCSSCGAVVRVLEDLNIGDLIHDLANKLGVTLS
jgi:hydrogenase maturation factor HypF (carbamoyltransferase family)